MGELLNLKESVKLKIAEQSEKEAKIQKLIATATSPRDKAFYQELLQKTVAERVNSTVSSSKEIDSSDPNSAKKKDQTPRSKI